MLQDKDIMSLKPISQNFPKRSWAVHPTYTSVSAIFMRLESVQRRLKHCGLVWSQDNIMLPRKNEHVPFSPKSQLIPRRTSPKKTPFPAVNLEHRCTVQSKSHLSTLSHLLFLFRNLVCICQAEKPAFTKSTAARIKVEHFTLQVNSPNHSWAPIWSSIPDWALSSTDSYYIHWDNETSLSPGPPSFGNRSISITFQTVSVELLQLMRGDFYCHLPHVLTSIPQ